MFERLSFATLSDELVIFISIKLEELVSKSLALTLKIPLSFKVKSTSILGIPFKAF